MSNADKLRKDADELTRLVDLTESANVKRFLSNEAERLQKLAAQEEKTEATLQNTGSLTIKPGLSTSKISNYGWDQSDKFVKFYVTFDGVQDIPSENVKVNFNAKSVELHIVNLEKRVDNVLAFKNLLHEIKPSESHFKVKTNMVVLFLKKSGTQHWACVTEAEKKAKDTKTPKLDKDADPSSSLMTLMKQMYDDGDDDMKRTISKAWTEARDKGQMPEDMNV